MSTDLKLEGRGSREQAFGIKATAKEEWNDPEELTSFKADHNMIKEIEVEIGAFGGLKVLDVSCLVLPRRNSKYKRRLAIERDGSCLGDRDIVLNGTLGRGEHP